MRKQQEQEQERERKRAKYRNAELASNNDGDDDVDGKNVIEFYLHLKTFVVVIVVDTKLMLYWINMEICVSSK